ncbi:hypothetical protein NKT34_01195 [Paenibacillus polysaccharolyticus]|uniref:hypothetical protein n=1 Tax=Paenibacillus TaxID=44249 RepID=UPI0012B9734E|nr:MULTISPECIES: hypothetical protein [Paenibacillus]MCP1131917.1 hypothetical protein [Paenibacillus polysaccharolyticus]
MKKIVSFAAALTLMGSMAAAAGAEEAVTGTVTPTTSGTEATTTSPATTKPAVEVNKPAVQTVEGKVETVTGSTYSVNGNNPVPGSDLMFEEPLVKPGDEVVMPTMLLNLLERTWFYDAPNGKPIGALSAQVVDTTGEIVDGFDGGEWVQVYTWKGKAWIHVAIQ